MLGTEVVYYLHRNTIPVEGESSPSAIIPSARRDRLAELAAVSPEARLHTGEAVGADGGAADLDNQSQGTMTDNIDTISQSIGQQSSLELSVADAVNESNEAAKEPEQAPPVLEVNTSETHEHEEQAQHTERSEPHGGDEVEKKSIKSITIVSSPVVKSNRNLTVETTDRHEKGAHPDNGNKVPGINKSPSRLLRVKPEMITLFQLQRQLFLRDPRLPVYQVNRVPTTVSILNKDLLTIVWSDGSYDMFSCPAMKEKKPEPEISTLESTKSKRVIELEPEQEYITHLLTVEAHVLSQVADRVTVPKHVLNAAGSSHFTVPGVASFQLLKWSSHGNYASSECGSALHEFEILTTGHDRVLRHWGLRKTSRPATRIELDADLTAEEADNDDMLSPTKPINTPVWEADMLGVSIVSLLYGPTVCDVVLCDTVTGVSGKERTGEPLCEREFIASTKSYQRDVVRRNATRSRVRHR
jgi:hypothetical protein